MNKGQTYVIHRCISTNLTLFSLNYPSSGGRNLFKTFCLGQMFFSCCTYYRSKIFCFTRKGKLALFKMSTLEVRPALILGDYCTVHPSHFSKDSNGPAYCV